MNGLTALEAKTKAGAPCDVSNISKRGRALVKAGASRVVRPTRARRRRSRPSISPRTASDLVKWRSWSSSAVN